MLVGQLENLRVSWRWMLVPLVVLVWSAAVFADDPAPNIVGVDQQWELVLAAPDPLTDAPQVVCVISPTSGVHSLHGAFELNQRTQPTFSPGGMQLQVWHGEHLRNYRSSPKTALLSTANETVTWTQSMRLDGGQLTFEITNGDSTTWGKFGEEGDLRVLVSTTLSSLNGYDPGVSVSQSGVAFATNRVQSLTLKKTVKHTSTSETIEDATPRTVYPKN